MEFIEYCKLCEVSNEEWDSSVSDALGNRYSKNMKKLLQASAAAQNRIAPQCEVICEDAFGDAEDTLTRVELPSGLRVIGPGAFENCRFLQEVFIPDTVEWIGYLAFDGCTSLRKVTIPATPLSDFPENCFSNCPSLEEFVSPGVAADGRSLICDGRLIAVAQAGLKEYIVPDEVTTIDFGFMIYKLMPGDKSVTYLGPESIVIPDNVTSIGHSCFEGCRNLKQIKLPKDLTTIEFDSFANCESLQEVIIPGSVRDIQSYAFQGCSSLKHVLFSEGLERIGKEAFKLCSSLESAVIPPSVKFIDNGAFSYCRNLSYVEIKGTESEIMPEAFASCSRRIMFLINPESKKEYTLKEMTSLQEELWECDSNRVVVKPGLNFVFGEDGLS